MLDELNAAATKLQNADMSGLSEIYQLTSKNVFTFILPILCDYQLAEDIMQATYIQVAENIASYQIGSNFRNWILTIAKNLALGELKRRKRETPTDDDIMMENLGNYCLNPDFDTPILKLAGEILSPEDYNIVIMFTIGDFKHREIAEILHLPLGTVTWKYNNALKKLRKSLDKEGNPL